MRLIDADAMIGRICGKNCGAKPIQCEEPCIEVRDILEEPTVSTNNQAFNETGGDT